jgi:hydroxyproline O-arabinosyltransferase
MSAHAGVKKSNACGRRATLSLSTSSSTLPFSPPTVPPPICDPRPNTECVELACTCQKGTLLPYFAKKNSHFSPLFFLSLSYWGDVLVAGPSHLTPTASACCAACGAHAARTAASGEYGALPCNVWVWCDPANPACAPAAGQCWLKHLPHAGAVPPRSGEGVPFTSGVTVPRAHAGPVPAVGPASERAYHTVITAAGPAVHWQSRVAHYWWRRVKKECETREMLDPESPPCHMGGFTRILHSGAPDDLVAEIPTWVAQPIEEGDKGGDGGYVVLNRPWAIVQWVRAARPREPYVLMAEPDHLWLRPLPNPLPYVPGGGGGGGNADNSPRLAAFPFFYIEPASRPNLPLTARFFAPQSPRAPPFTPDLAAAIPPIGNAPTLLSTDDLVTLAPVWDETAREVFHYPPTRQAWGWVLEMYAFAIAATRLGLASPSRPAALFPALMAQPPWGEGGTDGGDSSSPFPGNGTYLLHFTYGLDFSANGSATPGTRASPSDGGWHFDKRDWATGTPPPRGGIVPAPRAVRDGAARAVVDMINAATAALPGWDRYEETGVVAPEDVWDGVSF